LDLVTVREVKRLGRGEERSVQWQEGDAWVAGGTWLFSEPQVHLRRIIDLQGLGWEPLVARESGLEIAATCPVEKLEHFMAPVDWTAASLFRPSCHAFLASFKVQKVATVGGNVCMSLPAGPMITLAAGLEGVCKVLLREGGEINVPVVDFVTGNNRNILRPGDLLRSITLPASALRKRAAMRRFSMTNLGRSSIFLIATLCPETGGFVLTVTASTFRPVQIRFASLPSHEALTLALLEAIPDDQYFNDVHGTPAYRKHMTHYYAAQLRDELAGGQA